MALTNAQQLLLGSASAPQAPVAPIQAPLAQNSPASNILAQASAGDLSGAGSGDGGLGVPLMLGGAALAGGAGLKAIANNRAASAATSAVPSLLSQAGGAVSGAAPQGANSLLEYAPYQAKDAAGNIIKDSAGKVGLLARGNTALEARLPWASAGDVSLGGALALGAGGIYGSKIVGGMDIGGENSAVDQGLTGGIKWGGLAGAAAMALGMSNPITGLAIAGGAILGAWGEQGDHRTTPEQMQDSVTKSTQTIQSLGSQYGVDSTTLNNIMLQHQLTTQLMLQNKDKAGLKQYLTDLPVTVGQEMIQAKQQQDQQKQQYERQLSMQQTFAPIFSGIAGRAAQDNQVAYSNAVQAADQLQETNPQLASLIKANASSANQSSDAIMAAYAAQMSTVPNQAQSAGYYQGQNLLNQYTLPGTQQIQQPGSLTQSQTNQLAQLQMLQQAQTG